MSVFRAVATMLFFAVASGSRITLDDARHARTLERNPEEVRAEDVADGKTLEKRTKRLEKGGPTKLFHRTNMQACEHILKEGFKPGKYGRLGPAIYGTTASWSTRFKTVVTGSPCMVVFTAKLGHTLMTADAPYLHGALLLRWGYDSAQFPGLGYAIYFRDQITGLAAYPCDTMTAKRDGPYLGVVGDSSGLQLDADAPPPGVMHSTADSGGGGMARAQEDEPEEPSMGEEPDQSGPLGQPSVEHGVAVGVQRFPRIAATTSARRSPVGQPIAGSRRDDRRQGPRRAPAKVKTKDQKGAANRQQKKVPAGRSQEASAKRPLASGKAQATTKAGAKKMIVARSPPPPLRLPSGTRAGSKTKAKLKHSAPLKTKSKPKARRRRRSARRRPGGR